MAASVSRSRTARRTSLRGARKAAPGVVVAKDECLALIEDVAFFRAARFREVSPGGCREEDRCAAEAEIKAALKKLRQR